MGAIARQTLVAVTALAILVLSAGPAFLSLAGSLIPDKALFDPARGLLDEGLTLDQYRYIFTGKIPAAHLLEGSRVGISDAARQVPGSLLNSLTISLSVMALNILIGAPAAFAFARFVFPGKRVSFLFIILSPLVPAAALIAPSYLIIQWLGLLGTKAAIILVHTTKSLPFTVLILSVFFRKLPDEIIDAAVVDGCTRFQAFLRVALPLALPSVCATGLFAFMLSYAEFMYSMILSGDAASRPLSVVMGALARNIDVSWSLLNAGIFIAIVPTLALVVIVWRYIVEELLSGAVKG
jgi:ABC-type glycerol-3-phosphate transport system permease component